ncbi:hypothetical protein A2U01_0036344 [Trifolium medium]|uniref:Uncharacterized protein n=1 Tax=Trifolium medium TaxID=97028 RepID=A0A392PSY2_9FABA|nr:hypothetical protein [Trifolium medium]
MRVAQDQLRVAPTPEGQTALGPLRCALHQYKLRVAPKTEMLNRPYSLNCALRHMHLRVAPDTENGGIVPV